MPPCNDIMQVCRNGHVITDLLRSCPDSGRAHCDRCGADTLARCSTCGLELPGAVPLPGLVPVGSRRPPDFCPGCGAAFPWAARPAPARPLNSLDVLDTLFRRVPQVIRQLRTRHADRPPFRVQDEFDLQDLLRALLRLHFDDVRPEGRTPSYAPGVRTDFVLMPQQIAVTAKRCTRAAGEGQLATQLQEDLDYYRQRPGLRSLAAFIYDPDALLRDPRQLEHAWSRTDAGVDVRCVIAG